MNKSEVSKLLTVASAIDHRSITTEIVNAWHAIVGDIPFDEAQAALIAHRRSKPGVYFEPGHIIEQRKLRIARERELNGPHPAPPPMQRWAADAIDNDPRWGSGPGGVQVVSHEPPH